MQRLRSSIIAASAATLLLALGAGAAHASRAIALESPRTSFTATGRGTFRQETVSVITNTTLTGRLSAVSITKTNGTVFLEITGCSTGGTRTEGGVLFEEAIVRCDLGLPWRIAYRSFLGTLPNITGILGTIRGFAWLIERREGRVRINGCLFRGDVGALFGESRGGRTINEFRVLAGEVIPLAIELEQEFATERCSMFSRAEMTWSLEPPISMQLVS